MIRLLFISMFVLVFFGCNTRSGSNGQNVTTGSNCLPSITHDSVLYCGVTSYSDNTDNLDTVYNDTVLIYVVGSDSFGYSMWQLKYKELEFLDTTNPDFTVVNVTDVFLLNSHGVYKQFFESEEVKSKTTLKFSGDSLQFHSVIHRPSENKNEERLFLGSSVVGVPH